MTLADFAEHVFTDFVRFLKYRLAQLPPSRPKSITLCVSPNFTGGPMAATFTVTATLPAVPTNAVDAVAKQTIVTTVDGTAQPSADVPLTDKTYVVGTTFATGQVVSVSLVYVDATGNTSPPSIATITVPAVAIIVPPQPGTITLAAVQN